MGLSTKIQLISRKGSQQYYATIPSALAHAMDLTKGESVEWLVADKGNLILSRTNVPPNPVDIKKKG
jgi:antitoxin component of MazEF toxin-antitoxin module